MLTVSQCQTLPVRTEPPSERDFNGDVEFSTPKQVVDVDGDAGVEVDANGVMMSEGRTHTTGKRIRKPTRAFNHFQTKRRPVRVTKTSNAHKEVGNVVIDADAHPEPASAGKSEGGNYELCLTEEACH
ncbi:uncharacterized protein [Arachis hypogaea]|uniref:uncharacterized protein isoform X1 n=1 Tax=Arachis hypogaea TaxID=3818 RepID=UPI003B20C031|nr:uncharacterized protein DS421_16g563130 [Arachis hypogaea]